MRHKIKIFILHRTVETFSRVLQMSLNIAFKRLEEQCLALYQVTKAAVQLH